MSLERVLHQLAKRIAEHEHGTRDGYAPVAEAHRVFLALDREDFADVSAAIERRDQLQRLTARHPTPQHGLGAVSVADLRYRAHCADAAGEQQAWEQAADALEECARERDEARAEVAKLAALDCSVQHDADKALIAKIERERDEALALLAALRARDDAHQQIVSVALDRALRAESQLARRRVTVSIDLEQDLVELMCGDRMLELSATGGYGNDADALRFFHQTADFLAAIGVEVVRRDLDAERDAE